MWLQILHPLLDVGNALELPLPHISGVQFCSPCVLWLALQLLWAPLPEKLIPLQLESMLLWKEQGG